MDSSPLLNKITDLIRSHFGNVLIWDERSSFLRGKYFYTPIKGIQAGIFIGFTMDSDLVEPQKCVFFVFADPKSRIVKEIAAQTEQLLHQMLAELNQADSVKNSFSMVKGELPSLVRTLETKRQDETKLLEFFEESILLLIKVNASTCTP